MAGAEIKRPDTNEQRFRLFEIINRNHFELDARGVFDTGLDSGVLNDEEIKQMNGATRAAVYLERGSEDKKVKQTLKLKYITPFVRVGGSFNCYTAYVAVGYIYPESDQSDVTNGFNAEDLSIVNRMAELLLVEADTGYIPDLAPHLCDLKPNLPQPQIIVPDPAMFAAA